MTINETIGIPVVDARPEAECPHCREPTEITREAGPSVVASLNLDEMATLVRNEWRRRLGPQAYERRHPARFVRALTAFAAYPGSPIVRVQLEAGVAEVMADLRAEGRDSAAAERELSTLTFALRDVLLQAGLSSADAARVLRLVQRVLAEALYLPEGRAGLDG